MVTSHSTTVGGGNAPSVGRQPAEAGATPGTSPYTKEEGASAAAEEEEEERD